MQPAGARTLRDDDQQPSRRGGNLSLVEPEDRNAVLQQWERKIEREGRGARFDRRPAHQVAAVPAAAPSPSPAPGRRTITISGQPTPARRRPSLAERHIAAQPDRIALWAFLLGLFLVAVAAGSAHA